MFWAIVVIVVAVAAGAALGLVGRDRTLWSPIQAFAIVAASVVVAADLLPAALSGLGLWALVVFAFSFLVPVVAERFGFTTGPGREARLGLELGFGALVLHQLADGVTLGVFTSSLHAGHTHWNLLAGIGAHTIPLVAIVTIAFRHHRGLASAVVRAVFLALVSVMAVYFVDVVPVDLLAASEPWVAASAAGLLLHVVVHRRLPVHEASPLARALEVTAVLLGVGLLVVTDGVHHHAEVDSVPLRDAVATSFVDLLLETAPALVLGLALGALLQLWGSRIPIDWLRRGGNFRQAVRGALVGAPLPLCACGVLPVAHSLRARGAGAALVVAFLLATPELGVETFALTVRFLGWKLAFARLFGAVALAMVTALIVARSMTRSPFPSDVDEGGDRHVQRPASGSVVKRALTHFEELLFHVGPWTVLGLLAAAYVESTLPTASLGALSTWGLDVFLVTVIAVPSYVCAASATPLAAVLLAKGFSPGAVLVGLLLGPATNVATVGFLRHEFGGRATWIALATFVGATWVLAFALNVAPVSWSVGGAAADQVPRPRARWRGGATIVLAIVAVRSLWTTGPCRMAVRPRRGSRSRPRCRPWPRALARPYGLIASNSASSVSKPPLRIGKRHQVFGSRFSSSRWNDGANRSRFHWFRHHSWKKRLTQFRSSIALRCGNRLRRS